MPISRRESMSIAVLAGGTSPEREISFASGESVCRALKQAGYGRVETLDPADSGFLKEIESASFDAVFIALHGAGGEDGTIQGVLDYLHIPYTGSGVRASACAADKDVSKIIFEHAGIPVARGVTLCRGDELNPDSLVAELGKECFVKPAMNGSSLGVSLIRHPSELPKAVERAFESSDKVLIEQRLIGTEISVGVLGGRDAKALPVVEIMGQEGTDFYNKEVKYIDPALVHRIPARLPTGICETAGALALGAHRALGCYGFSRSDFIVTEEGPVILETNTIPGMTEASLFPDEIRHCGRTFAEACDEMIMLALQRVRA
ncbi:D-alanine--D-alanine ligase [Coriobacterium glomerans PW2]|uniref:D-alanine--D-alanine ligase n=1 Tax=Coriobacterium glomerans (strain ATCC 49209 / DSM 20642 / JCM 10262 / PW2) TaxID=700015 RepID=F2N9E1_CORGP|nr:D-alanine--D-alanine ligase [Coriobacterium glomerans]AEB07889.1 D-alanine--D-alanine ligase [Coriobacterium glomerans PW2]